MIPEKLYHKKFRTKNSLMYFVGYLRVFKVFRKKLYHKNFPTKNGDVGDVNDVTKRRSEII